MEFHPDIVHMEDTKEIETDINRNHGRYNEYNYNNIAFYVRDYNASTNGFLYFHFANSASCYKINAVILPNTFTRFFTVRRTVEGSIPITRSDRDIPSLLKLSQDVPVTSLFEMFVSFSNIHVLRAVEPTLKVKYKSIDCNSTYSSNIYRMCRRSKNFHLGQRSQLAKLVLDYESYKNSLSERRS